MNEPIAERYRRLSTTFAERVAAVRAPDWSNPSPCEGWTAQDVVRHVVDSHEIFLGFLGRSLPEEAPGADQDPVGAFDEARRSVQACLDDPELAATEYEGLFGKNTFEAGVDGFLSFDLNVHGWDLARAVGAEDDRIDPAEVPRLRREAEAFGETMRGRAGAPFGPVLQAPEGADEQADLLAYLGRDPDQ